MAPLERLIELAKKTGDRLIVHDPYSDRDVVIMDVDQYVRMVRGKENVRDMSGKELVEKVNRDIAVWHSDREAQEQEEMWQLLEQELQYRVGGNYSGQQEETPEETLANAWHALSELMPKHDLAPEDEQSSERTIDQKAQDEGPLPEIILMQTEEQEQDGETDLTYEIPVEDSAPTSSAIEWEMESGPRSRMKEGLTHYKQQSQPYSNMEQKSQDLAKFSQQESVEDSADGGPVFFEEPV